MQEFKKISILVPVFNEEKTISTIIDKIKSSPLNLEKEIVIVNDCSTDKTKQELEKLEGCKIIHHETNQGKGAALKTAIENATGDIMIVQDADLEYNPEDYTKVLAPILQNEFQVVYGSRFLEKNKTFTFKQVFANKFLTHLTNLLYGSNLTDMETCYKAFTKDAVDNITINSKKFNFEPEITAKILKKGLKIKEVPISYNGRSYEEGKKINYKDALQAIVTLFKYKFKD